jgi:hypothetical protein
MQLSERERRVIVELERQFCEDAEGVRREASPYDPPQVPVEQWTRWGMFGGRYH